MCLLFPAPLCLPLFLLRFESKTLHFFFSPNLPFLSVHLLLSFGTEGMHLNLLVARGIERIQILDLILQLLELVLVQTLLFVQVLQVRVVVEVGGRLGRSLANLLLKLKVLHGSMFGSGGRNSLNRASATWTQSKVHFLTLGGQRRFEYSPERPRLVRIDRHLNRRSRSTQRAVDGVLFGDKFEGARVTHLNSNFN